MPVLFVPNVVDGEKEGEIEDTHTKFKMGGGREPLRVERHIRGATPGDVTSVLIAHIRGFGLVRCEREVSQYLNYIACRPSPVGCCASLKGNFTPTDQSRPPQIHGKRDVAIGSLTLRLLVI